MSYDNQRFQKALFGGGCFWCMQQPFEILDGVVEVKVGYAGGDEPEPSFVRDLPVDQGEILVDAGRFEEPRVEVCLARKPENARG